MAASKKSVGVELIVPSWELSAQMGLEKAGTFRLRSKQEAEALGYKAEVDGKTTRFTRGRVTVSVTYSDKDFVQTVEVGGKVVIRHDASDKFGKLNKTLATLAKPVPRKPRATK